MATLTTGFSRVDDDNQSDEDYVPLYDDGDEPDQRTAQETKGWNLFRELPVKKESGSMATSEWIDFSVKALKLLAYILTFFVVLGSAVVAKGTLLFITSQLKKGRHVVHCNRALALDRQFLTTLTLEERLTWLWAAIIVFGAPEIGVFLRSVRICFFKTAKKPTTTQFFIALIVETLSTIGLAMLILMILPELDVVKGAMIMNALCIVPGFLNAITRDRSDSRYFMKLVLDVLSVSAQATAFVLWPMQGNTTILWYIPLACIFVSLGWWENFLGVPDKHSPGIYIYLCDLRDGLKKCRYYTEMFLSIWKILVFMACVIVSLHLQGDDPFSIFTSVTEAFGERNYTAQEGATGTKLLDLAVVLLAAACLITNMPDPFVTLNSLVAVYNGRTQSYFRPEILRQYHVFQDLHYIDDLNFQLTDTIFILTASWTSSFWVALIQVSAAYVCYISAKFACKILIQSFSFAFSLSLVGPLTVNLLIVFCGIKNVNSCAFYGTIPDYLFFEIPPVYTLREYVGPEMAWVWVLWLASQAWICLHTWQPRCERLAATDKLFCKPWYNGPLIDQSLLMNRTHDVETDISYEELKEKKKEPSESSEDGDNDVKPTDSITRIYICATMWHETKDEMIEFLKSIFRLDEDQCSQRVARKYWGIVNNDYYELEAHIFMDDAFEISDHSPEESQVNAFVKCLVNTIDDAASEVHVTNVRLRAPKKYPTPYGGQLVWTLPGKNKLICHLKDKAKIRHRKRWSQVMYMYYFLGHRLMDLPISIDRKEVIAENTYLLALDGDIDFQPSAVTLLIDLMKKDKNLGAACGRIHPVGTGFMAWYQMFEYAIGHWLQKATEHMIGCVLCSPGCFSLFRGKALMDDNVMRKYTLTSNEARHYVQYDQGEDRWLCTLLLQRGYRVEYSAASDAYTHCPERFDEFYNQRRRWVPSTMANILDLLADYKRTVKVNDNISTLYIVYQMFLMVGTVLGPGTIFLMMVGAMNAITGMSNINALILNLIPIAIYITVCMTCKSSVQIFLANAITCAYAMVMMLVIVGIALQITEDGWLAPSSIFTVITFGSFFVTAIMHPQEMICLLYLGVYYITIPSMYMLLIIYSLCNLNNVTWGTREIAQKKSAKELQIEQKEVEQAKQKMDNKAVLKWLGKSEEESGSLECGAAGLFRCMCCTNPKDHKDDLHLLQITNAIEKMEKKLDTLGATAEVAEAPRRRSTIGLRRDSVNLRRETLGVRRESINVMQDYADSDDSTDIPKEERDDLVNPYWIEDPGLQKGEVDFLLTSEIEFWKDLIDAYLRPIEENKEEQERIKNDLKTLRDTMVFAFIMLNSLFVLTIFLLQLNQDQLHIRWPLGQSVVISYDDDMNIVTLNREYLMLEPIGSLFLVFFGSVMVIQFTAMFFHRLGTLTHLLATVQLGWFFAKKPEDTTDHAKIEKDAVNFAKNMQRADMSDLDNKLDDDKDVARRKTLHALDKARVTKSNVFNLDENFKRRMTILENADPKVISGLPWLSGDVSTRRATLRALKTRRESVVAEKRRSIMQGRPSGDNYMYSVPGTSGFMPRRDTSASVYANNAYEPAEDSDDDNVPRQSVVRFRENYA